MGRVKEASNKGFYYKNYFYNVHSWNSLYVNNVNYNERANW